MKHDCRQGHAVCLLACTGRSRPVVLTLPLHVRQVCSSEQCSLLACSVSTLRQGSRAAVSGPEGAWRGNVDALARMVGKADTVLRPMCVQRTVPGRTSRPGHIRSCTRTPSSTEASGSWGWERPVQLGNSWWWAACYLADGSTLCQGSGWPYVGTHVNNGVYFREQGAHLARLEGHDLLATSLRHLYCSSCMPR